MKVFLLCVDALEYDFVKNRDYYNLKQNQFLKVRIPREAMTIFEGGILFEDSHPRVGPFTPVIWKAIFTGKIEQKELKAKPKIQHWENSIMNWLKSRSIANRLYVFLIQKGFVKSGLPTRLGFKRKDYLRSEETLISKSSNPVIIHNPLKVNVKWSAKGLNEGFEPKEIIESRLEVFHREKEETFKKMSKNWDLLVVYTKFLDVIGHLCWQKDRVVAKYYHMIDYFAGEIQEKLSDDVCMIIISDHGMMPLRETNYQGGEHSHHAFFSSSHRIEVPNPLEITDLYDIIVHLLNCDQREITEKS